MAAASLSLTDNTLEESQCSSLHLLRNVQAAKEKLTADIEQARVSSEKHALARAKQDEAVGHELKVVRGLAMHSI